MLILVLTAQIWLTAIGSFLVSADPPTRSEMIVVPGGDLHGRRILNAAELVRRGLAPAALISGPEDCCYGHDEPELAIAFAIKHGYPASYFIAFPNRGLSTREEATLVTEELRKHNIHRINLVTSDYHTRRSGRIYRSLAPDVDIHVVATADQYFSPGGWWKTREGQKIFIAEWTKTIASWLGI